MDLSRFEHLAQAYGGEFARWPHAARCEAEALVAEQEKASLILARERRLDMELSSFAIDPPSADLQRRVLTRLLVERRPSLRMIPWVSALAAGLGAGVVSAGVLAGLCWVAILPVQQHSGSIASVYAQSSFGDLDVVDDGGREGPGA